MSSNKNQTEINLNDQMHKESNDIDVNKCKKCKSYYDSLLKHLGQRMVCHQAYTELELKNLKHAVKLKSNEKISRRKKEYYQRNYEQILHKKADQYQKKKKVNKENKNTENN